MKHVFARVGTVKKGTAVQWPAGIGIGAKGSEGVTGQVRQLSGAIGYAELAYADQNKIPYADLKNAAGKFVTASFDSVTAAAANSKDLAPDFRGSITNAPGAGSYPISTYTWLLIPNRIPDAAKKKALVDFLNWMLGPGQKDAQPLYYAPLPTKIVDLEKKQIGEVK